MIKLPDHEEVGSVGLGIELSLDGLTAAVKDAGNYVRDKLSNAFVPVEAAAATMKNAVEKVVQETSAAIGHDVEQAGNNASQVARESAGETVQVVKQAQAEVEQAIADTQAAQESQAAAVEQSAEQVGQSVSQVVQKAAEETVQAVNEAQAEISKVLSDTGKNLESQSAWDAVKNAAADSTREIRNNTERTFSKTGKSIRRHLFSALSGFKDKVKQESTAAGNSMTKAFKQSAADVKAMFDMVLGAIRSVISSCREWLSAYQTQIESESRLEATMRNTTAATKEQIQSVKDLASEYQALGVIGDEVQLAGAQELATYVSTTDSIKSMLPVLNDMIAQQYGYSASADSAVSIATMLGKVLQGQTSALSRYGYSFTKAQEQVLKYGTEEQKVAVLSEVVSESIGGVNAALANTPTGKIKQLSNDFGDLKETLGGLVTNILCPIVKWLDVIVVKLNNVFSMANAYVKQLFGITDESASGSAIASLADNGYDAAEAIDGANESVKALKKSLAGFDQLNIISDDKDASGANGVPTGSSAGISTLTMDTSPVSKAGAEVEKLIDKLGVKLKQLANFTGFTKLTDNIKNGISQINFDGIKNNLSSVFTSLKEIAEGTFGSVQETVSARFGTIGAVIGGVISTAGNLFQTFTGGVAQWLEECKDKITNTINEVADNLTSGYDRLTGAVNSIVDIINSSIERTRETVENAIANMLGGITDFVDSVMLVASAMFDDAAASLNKWIADNEKDIGEFLDNVSQIFTDTMNLIGKIFSDAGNDILSWWQTGGGEQMWQSFCDVVGDLGEIFMQVFDDWIMPVWNTFISMVQSAWDNCLRPSFNSVIGFLTKLWNEILVPLWNKVLKPLVKWFVDEFGKKLNRELNSVKSVFDTVFTFIGEKTTAIYNAFSGLIDFVTGALAGDWEKAWNGIGDCFTSIWNDILATMKVTINLIVDGINGLWTGIYNFVGGIVDAVGGVAGAIGSVTGQNWSFSMPAEPPLIPKLAQGGLVNAPTLALVGDNKNAKADPEVIAPLSKLEAMLGSGDTQVVAMLGQIITLLSGQEQSFQNNIYLDGELIDRKLVKVKKRKTRRYGGAQ